MGYNVGDTVVITKVKNGYCSPSIGQRAIITRNTRGVVQDGAMLMHGNISEHNSDDKGNWHLHFFDDQYEIAGV